jgi:hypothetical protein
MIEFSRRYGVIGVYRDRDTVTWRFYPVPFVRITWDRTGVDTWTGR